MFKNVANIVRDISAKMWNGDIDRGGSVVDFTRQIDEIYTQDQKENRYFTTALAGIMAELFDNREIQKNQEFIRPFLYFYICALQGADNIIISDDIISNCALRNITRHCEGRLESGVFFNTVSVKTVGAAHYFEGFINYTNTPVTINQLNVDMNGYICRIDPETDCHVINCKCLDNSYMNFNSYTLKIDNLILMPGGSINSAKDIKIRVSECIDILDVSNLPYDIRLNGDILHLILNRRIKKIYKRNNQKILCPSGLDKDIRPIVC